LESFHSSSAWVPLLIFSHYFFPSHPQVFPFFVQIFPPLFKSCASSPPVLLCQFLFLFFPLKVFVSNIRSRANTGGFPFSPCTWTFVTIPCRVALFPSLPLLSQLQCFFSWPPTPKVRVFGCEHLELFSCHPSPVPNDVNASFLIPSLIGSFQLTFFWILPFLEYCFFFASPLLATSSRNSRSSIFFFRENCPLFWPGYTGTLAFFFPPRGRPARDLPVSFNSLGWICLELFTCVWAALFL